MKISYDAKCKIGMVFVILVIVVVGPTIEHW